MTKTTLRLYIIVTEFGKLDFSKYMNGKIDFAEGFKILLDTDLCWIIKIILLEP